MKTVFIDAVRSGCSRALHLVLHTREGRAPSPIAKITNDSHSEYITADKDDGTITVYLPQ